MSRWVTTTVGYIAGIVSAAAVCWLLWGPTGYQSHEPDRFDAVEDFGELWDETTDNAEAEGDAAESDDGSAALVAALAAAPANATKSAAASREQETSGEESSAAKIDREKPFPPGRVVLMIGDHYRFGEPAVVPLAMADEELLKLERAAGKETGPGAESDDAGGVDKDDDPDDSGDPPKKPEVVFPFDLVCYDVRNGVCVLGAPHGGEGLYHPRIVVGPSPKQDQMYKSLVDAPDDLAQTGKVTLYAKVGSRERAGIGLIRGRDGKVYKVRLVAEDRADAAFDRAVALEYAELPVVPGGGNIALPHDTIVADLAPDQVYEALKELRALTSKLPGRNSYLRVNKGQLLDLVQPPSELIVKKDRHLVVPHTLSTILQLDRGGLIYAGGGVAPSGEVRYKRGSGVAVIGAMAGWIEAGSTSTVLIDGDLTGTVECNRSTTLYVFGSVYGAVRLNYRSTIIVRGDVIRDRDWLVVGKRGGGDIYLDGYYPRERIERFPSHRGVTLHVRESDLKKGRHRIAGFRQVVVADRVWSKFE